MEEIDRIICMIENVGLNATRHQDQQKAMTEANEIRKHLEALVSKNESLHDVSHQRRLFNSFIKWIDYEFDQGEYTEEVKQHVEDYLKTIK